jgi:hypothetical protein
VREAAGGVPVVLGERVARRLLEVLIVADDADDARREHHALDAFDPVRALQDVAGSVHGRVDQVLLRVLDPEDRERRGRVEHQLAPGHGFVERAVVQQVSLEESQGAGGVLRHLLEVADLRVVGGVANGGVDVDAVLEQVLDQPGGDVPVASGHQDGRGSIDVHEGTPGVSGIKLLRSGASSVAPVHLVGLVQGRR